MLRVFYPNANMENMFVYKQHVLKILTKPLNSLIDEIIKILVSMERCFGKSGLKLSNRKMLQLASKVVISLKILTKPLNLLIDEIVHDDSSDHWVLNHLVGGWRGKLTKRRTG